MPRVALTDDQKEEADKAGGADLKFLFAKYNVSLENQRLFYHFGVTSVEKLGTLAKDRDDMVEVLKDSWALDQASGLDQRVQVAAIICAFQQCSLEGAEGGRGRCRVWGPGQNEAYDA